MTTFVGVIGWPLDHSLSPTMHNAVFEALGMDWRYEIMPIPKDIIHLGLREPQRYGYVGINVTIPHKEAVMGFVKPDERARAIGAVNTIDLRTMEATNTDVIGLIDDLKAHNVELDDKNIIVLGAGGASRAAVYGLTLAGANVTVVNRTLQRANLMLADLTISSGIRTVSAKTLDEAVESPIDVIVNCTSAGMYPHIDTSPWVEGVPIPKDIVLYDMVYRPQQTKLMGQVEKAGGRAISGLGMLVRQGAEAFKIWTGVDPPLEVMFDAVKEALGEA